MYKFSNLQKMTLTALLLAFYIIATRFIGFYVTPMVRFSVGVPILIFSSLLLGPLPGAIIGALGDILGILIFNPLGTAINPFMPFTYALMGAAPGLIHMFFKKFQDKEKLSLIIFNSLLLVIWILIIVFSLYVNELTLFNKDNVVKINMVAKILIIVISFILMALISFFTYFINKKFKVKNMYKEKKVNIYEIAFIVIFIEVFFTLLCNSVFKWIFYELILGQTSPFILIFFPALLMAFIYIPLNTFLVISLCLLARKTIKNN